MATPAYDGGIGGKFRKRPLRRPPTTPYDRPPPAAPLAAAVPPPSGAWLRSLLVDPASRLISRSASRLFASFKRIAPAPPAAPPPEENHHSGEAVLEVPYIDPSPELHDRGYGGGQQTKSPDLNSSDTDGISELEKLLKQKTFTRVEFDHLTELLRSRTVEPSTSEPAIHIKKKENEDSSAQADRVHALISHENPSTTAACLTATTRDEVASPAEVAKAYMGSKVSPSTLSLRSQVFHEDTTLTSIVPSVSKPLSRSVVPRSVIHFSGIRELPENSYQTPKPRGRSAFCPMSCSPYLKVHPTTNAKALKRGSSVLDSDFESFGPVRRIRQKSYLSSPRDGYSILSNKEVNRGSSLQKPSRKGFKHHNTFLQEAENKEKKFGPTSVIPIPPKSSETAKKIFEKLDIIVSSPTEKSPQLKTIASNESPSNLTPNASGGRTSRKLGNTDPSKFCSAQDGGSLDSNGDSQLFSFRNSLSEKQYKIEENGPSQPAFSGVKLTSESCSAVNGAVPYKNAESRMLTVSSTISGSAYLQSRDTTSFQRSAFEDPLACDDDKLNPGDPSGPLSSKSDELEAKVLKHSEKSPMSSSTIPGSPSSLKDAGMNGSGSLVLSGKDTGFSFSVASGLSTQSQPPPIPTMHAPSHEVSALGKEHTVAPAFSFGSKAGHTGTVSTTMASIAETTCQNVGARDATLASGIEEGSRSCRSGEMPKDGKLSEPFGSHACSGISATNSSAVFGFGSDTTTSQSNHPLYSSSLISQLSAAPSVTDCDSRVASSFFASTATRGNTSPVTSVSSPSMSTSAPIFSTVASFKFGSSTSMSTPVSISHSANDSKSTNLEAAKVSTNSSTAPYSSSFSSMSSTIFFTTSAFSSSDCSSSSRATLASSPSTGSNSASLAVSSAVTSTGSIFSFSVPAASSAVTSTGGIFSVPAQPNTSANISQNSAASGATAGYALGTVATQSGSESLSSRNQFGSFSSSSAFGLSKPSSSDFGSSPFGLATSGTETSTTSGFHISGGFVSSGPGTGSSLMPAAASSLLSPSSQPFKQSAFGSSFGSSASSPSPGSLFGQLSSVSSSSMLTLDSSKPEYSFTSVVSAPLSATSPARPVFGMPTPAFGFSSGSPGTSQMNVENGMTDVTNQVTTPTTPTFGQPVNPPTTPNFVFGSGTIPSGGTASSQFVGNQNPFTPQSPPFQAGGVFSVGTGGGDKSGRKIIKIKRDKKHKR